MKVVAISVGAPMRVEWEGRLIETSIFKTPVSGRLLVTRLNLEGDKQSDLSVHGGLEKAVYAYPSEHYSYWAMELPEIEFPWGAFGENLTTEGLMETEVCIGDQYRIGSGQFVVTQPRMPCYKLGIRFGRADMVKRFQQSGRSGFYLAVASEGNIGAGDEVERIVRDERGLTVAEIVRLYTARDSDQGLLRRAIDHPALATGWREHFKRRLTQVNT